MTDDAVAEPYAGVADAFGLGAVQGVTELAGGGPEVVRLETARGSFVAKRFHTTDDLELAALVGDELPARGVRQARLLRTAEGALADPTGYSVQEWLPGQIDARPSAARAESFARHLWAYDTALAALELPARLRARLDHRDTVWTRVTEPEFLLARLGDLVREQAPWLDPAPVDEGLERLRASGGAALIGGLPRQLVHADHGPGNVMWDERDEVVAVLDFSPGLHPRLFSLGTAAYWHHVYGRGRPDVVGVERDLAAYLEEAGDAIPDPAGERRGFAAFLLTEALRRFATPLEVAATGGGSGTRTPSPHPERLEQRYRAVPRTLEALDALETSDALADIRPARSARE